MKKKILLITTLILSLANVYGADYFVSEKSGNDKNDGSESTPFKTIQKAANIAKAGDVVTVKEGVYREEVNPINSGISDFSRITYQGAMGEKIELKGSEIIKNWQKQDNGIWKVVLDNKFFADHNPYKTLLEGDWLNNKDNLHTGEVYLNGKSLYEMGKLENLTNDKLKLRTLDKESSKLRWYCESDDKTTTIYANFGDKDPNKELVEIAMRKSCFYPKEQAVNFITIKNFDVSQAATQWGAPTAEQIGMISTNWNKGWIIEGNIIHDTKASGITLGKERKSGHNVWSKNRTKDGSVHYIEVTFKAIQEGWNKDNIGHHIVRNNEIYNCEQTGMCGSFGAAFSLVENNYIHDIWTKRLFAGAEIGGIKFHAPIDTVIRDNYIINCGRGIWLDWMVQGTRVTGNLIAENTTDDIHVEVNHGPFVLDNNILLSRIGIYVFSGGGLYVNNYIDGLTRTFFAAVRPRYTPYHFAHSTAVKGVSANTNDSKFFNNLYAASFNTKEANANNKNPTAAKEVFGNSNYNFVTLKRDLIFNVNNNAYLGKANAYNKEAKLFKNSKANADTKLIKEDGKVYLSFTLPEDFADFKADIIRGSNLGITDVSEEAFENADGSELIIDRDYFGNKIDASNVKAGAFQDVRAGINKIQVWPKK